MTKTSKFNTGDRVVMIKSDPLFDTRRPEPPNGTLGTVTEVSVVPYVDFDGHGVFVVDQSQIETAPKAKPKKAPKVKAANTKIAKLRSHFLSGRSLTQLEAIGLYGAFRLAARVHELKGDGMKIVTRMKEDPNGNPYAEYQLRSPWVKG